MAGVPAQPVPLDLVGHARRIEPLPQVGIRHRRLGRRLPAPLLPGDDPLADALLDVFGVGVEIDAGGMLQGFERGDGGHQLHAVVGRQRLAAADLLAVLAGGQDRAPSAGPGISRAGAVGIDDHRRPFRHAAGSSRPYSLAERMLRWNLSRRRYSSGSLRLTSASLAVCRQSYARVSRKRSAAPRGNSGRAWRSGSVRTRALW